MYLVVITQPRLDQSTLGTCIRLNTWPTEADINLTYRLLTEARRLHVQSLRK